MTHVYDAGRDAALRYPHWRIVRRPLSGAYGFTSHRRKLIVIDVEASRVEWECTVAHELVHLDRGDRCTLGNPVVDERREKAVCRVAARRMVTVEQLARAELFGRLPGDVAAELGVDVPTLRAFVDSLSDLEWAVINGQQQDWGAA